MNNKRRAPLLNITLKHHDFLGSGTGLRTGSSQNGSQPVSDSDSSSPADALADDTEAFARNVRAAKLPRTSAVPV